MSGCCPQTFSVRGGRVTVPEPKRVTSTRRRVVTGRLIDRPASPRPLPGRLRRGPTTPEPEDHRPSCTPAESGPIPDPSTAAASPRPVSRRCSRASVSCSTAGDGSPRSSWSRSLILVAVGALLFATQPTIQLAAMAAAPSVLAALLTLNLILLLFRLLAVGQAFLDTRRPGPTGRLGLVGIAIIAVLVVTPHVLAYRYGTAFGDTFARVFDAEGRPGRRGTRRELRRRGPAPDERINILLLGVDNLPSRTATLTDTMMVASLDPVGKTVSLVSVPRDLIGVPLGNGDDFGPKLNSLMAYRRPQPEAVPRRRHPRAARTRSARCSGSRSITTHERSSSGSRRWSTRSAASMSLVPEGFDDPTYDGFGLVTPGYSIDAGRHHLDGLNALAYARARKADGESDFTRAARQQQVLVALRDAVTKDGSLLWELPALLEPSARPSAPTCRSSASRSSPRSWTRSRTGRSSAAVIRHPLVRSARTRYGSSLEPDLAAIREVANGPVPGAGRGPEPWPTPKPSQEP